MENENQELRAYFFQNMYLQGIHAGIQSQHTTAEMFIKYAILDEEEYKQRGVLYSWASENKTSIVLNGGMSGDLEELVDFLDTEDNQYPWDYFEESEYALNGTITNVGIILPEKIFNYTKLLKSYESGEITAEYVPQLTEYEKQLATLLSSKRLMN